MKQVSKVALPVVALVLSVATLTLSVTALASPTTTTTLSHQTLSDGTAYADAFLALQPIPPGARLVTTLPTPLSPMGASADGGAVRSASREYELPLSVSVEKYVKSHLPTGESVNGTGTGGGPGTPTTDSIELTANCVNPHITYCGAWYQTADITGHQELRVDVQVVWLPIVHVTMPTTGLVTVTGFAATSLMRGASSPSSIVLSTSQAHRLSEQIADLKDMNQGAVCMEDSALLYISVTQNGKVVWKAIADECPGELRITGTTGTHLLDDRSCALWHLVNSFFPAGTAAATKTDSLNTCADIDNG
jgi:hypothetical protein